MGIISKLRKKNGAGRSKQRGGLSSSTTQPVARRPSTPSSIMATTVQPPSHALLSASLPPKAPSVSNQASISDAASLPSDNFEPWTQAYKMMQTREPELMGD
ncbi:hypothetical protein BDV11DRAFT_199759 [Aspergillus similis]